MNLLYTHKYIMNNRHITHLFTSSLSGGHLQIQVNLIYPPVGHEGPIRFLPS